MERRRLPKGPEETSSAEVSSRKLRRAHLAGSNPGVQPSPLLGSNPVLWSQPEKLQPDRGGDGECQPKDAGGEGQKDGARSSGGGGAGGDKKTKRVEPSPPLPSPPRIKLTLSDDEDSDSDLDFDLHIDLHMKGLKLPLPQPPPPQIKFALPEEEDSRFGDFDDEGSGFSDSSEFHDSDDDDPEVVLPNVGKNNGDNVGNKKGSSENKIP